MGGAVSTGVDNDDLIDNLFENNNLKTENVVRVFRSVDRGMYFLPESKTTAYRDSAWKEGHLHISAPCIYAEVLEALDLEPGMSFLNIGSGTGYLSTMAGLMLGTNAMNHGIEVHESNVKYALERLQDFAKSGVALRYFDFAMPQFVVGNGLKLSDKYCGRYDRMYVGSACNDDEHVQFLAKFLKIGGKMIVPVDEKLVKITRLDNNELKKENLISCSFASLLDPQPDAEIIELPKPQLMSLKHACRAVIVRAIRSRTLAEHPEVWMPRAHPKRAVSEARRRPQRIIVPLLIAQNDGDEEPQIMFANPFNVESNDNGNDAPEPGDFEDDVQDEEPTNGNGVGESDGNDNLINSSDGQDGTGEGNGDSDNDLDDDAVMNAETVDQPQNGCKKDKICEKDGGSVDHQASAFISFNSDWETEDEDPEPAGSHSGGSSAEHFLRKRRLSARYSCSEGHDGHTSEETPKKRSGEQGADRDDPAGSASVSHDSPAATSFGAENGEPVEAVSQLNAAVSETILTLQQLRQRILTGLRARSQNRAAGRQNTDNQSGSRANSGENSPGRDDGGTPDISFISPASLMEKYTMDALLSLPYPRNFLRFLNFDRPLQV